MNKRQIDFTTPHSVALKKVNSANVEKVISIAPAKRSDVMTAKEVRQLLGCGRTTAYTLIAKARAKWPDVHRYLPPGCVSEELFMGQFYKPPRKEKT